MGSVFYYYGICLVKELDKKYVRSPSTGSHVPDENQKALDESENRSLVSLITALLSPDAHVRPTASEALYSDFFTSAELLSHKSVFEDEFNEIRSRGKGDDEERQEGDAPFDRDFITIQAARDRSCSLCGSTVDMLQGVTCSDKHFTCSTCVESHLLSYLQTDVLSARSILLFDKATKKEVCVSRTPHEIIAALSLEGGAAESLVTTMSGNPWSDLHTFSQSFDVRNLFVDQIAVLCPASPPCSSLLPHDSCVGFVTPETVRRFQVATDDLRVLRQLFELENSRKSQYNRIAAISDPRLRSAEKSRFISDSIKPLRCPKCSEDCSDVESSSFALACPKCQCGFCSLCQADCGSDASIHCLSCPFNGSGKGRVSHKEYAVAQEERVSRTIASLTAALPAEISIASPQESPPSTSSSGELPEAEDPVVPSQLFL
jgi:hypothetical protein